MLISQLTFNRTVFVFFICDQILKMSSSTRKHNRNVAIHKWTIPNFSSCSSGKSVSPSFGFPFDNGTQFQLVIDPSFHSNHWKYTYVTICVYLLSCSQDRLKIKYRMSIVNAQGVECNALEGIESIHMRYCNCTSVHLLQYNVRRDVLMDSFYGMLVNDTLTIVCELELVANDYENLHAKPVDFSRISQNYETLLKNAKHSDVVLSIGEKEFPAHKLVLSTRSPFFAAMFDHSDTIEAQQGRVEIRDVPVEVFELFRRYLYTDKIDGLDRYAQELLNVAEMYQMDCLKSLCVHFLCSTLTIGNASEMLIYADLYRSAVLKRKCIDYITDNLEKVQATEGWKVLYQKNDLLTLLLANFSIKLNSVNK